MGTSRRQPVRQVSVRLGVCKKWLPEKERKVGFPHGISLVPRKETNAIWYSIRAWRGLRYNESYASKLERKLAQKREHESARPTQLEGHDPAHQGVNPFAVR